MDLLGEPLSGFVGDLAFGEPAPYQAAEIVQVAATVRGVDRLRNLICKHASSLGVIAAREGVLAIGKPDAFAESAIPRLTVSGSWGRIRVQTTISPHGPYGEPPLTGRLSLFWRLGGEAPEPLSIVRRDCRTRQTPR